MFSGFVGLLVGLLDCYWLVVILCGFVVFKCIFMVGSLVCGFGALDLLCLLD